MIGVDEHIHVVDIPTLRPSAMIGIFENISVFDLPAVIPMAVSLKTVVGTNVTVQSGGDRLLQDARLLAQAAIIDANSADGKLMEIAKADEALSLGDAEAAGGNVAEGTT